MGFDFGKFLQILTTVAPVILLAVPGGAALAPVAAVIVTGIADAQKKPGATGPEKKAFVLQLVKDATEGAVLVKPGAIDPVLVQEAAGHAIDAVIATVHAVQGAHDQLPHVLTAIDPPPSV